MSRINANTNKSLQCDWLGKKHSGKRYNPIYGTKYSRMDGGKFFKGCLPQILLGLFLNTLPQIFLSGTHLGINDKDYSRERFNCSNFHYFIFIQILMVGNFTGVVSATSFHCKK